MATSDTYYQTNVNAHVCPVCGSDMKRNKDDDPMDQSFDNCVCMNSACNAEAKFIN